jgi:hypothetical protein
MNNINHERSKNLATEIIINAWDTQIRKQETNKTRTRLQTADNNHRLLSIARTGSPLAYRVIWARRRDKETEDRDVRERNIGETVTTC